MNIYLHSYDNPDNLLDNPPIGTRSGLEWLIPQITHIHTILSPTPHSIPALLAAGLGVLTQEIASNDINTAGEGLRALCMYMYIYISSHLSLSLSLSFFLCVSE